MVKWAVLMACLAASGCTIVALSEDVEQAECQSFIDCDVLNLRDREDFDRCNIWQCRERRCVYTSTDVDNDGFGIPICADVGSINDCEDTDPERHPDHPELCDNKDNDCDMAIDEGMLQVAHTKPLVFTEPVREFGYAWDSKNMELGVVYCGQDDRSGFAFVRARRANSPGRLGLSRAPAELRGTGVNAGLRMDRFIATITEAEPPHRIWVGHVVGNLSPFVLNVEDELLRATGLRCTRDEACAPSEEPPIGIPASTTPNLAALELFVLASYARRGEPTPDGCGTAEPQPVLVNLLIENFSELREITREAVKLGETRSGRAPALLSIDAAAVQNAIEQFGWLAAYPDADGRLIVRRLQPDPNDVLGSLRLEIEPPAEPYVHVQLALGAVSTDRFDVGIVAQEGCGSDARIQFGVLSLSWDLAGRSELRVYRELRRISEDAAERPVLAYNDAQASWGIAYANSDGLFARVVNRDGVARGESAYRIQDSAPTGDYTIVSPTDTGLGVFGVYSYVESPDQSPAYALDAAHLRTCAP